ncbi:G5 domain-containing protein [Aerococcus sp. Group 2]|uniref:G5 domain-containing protein n=1 Tax=Aerococcus sp. Group 2 TaxID=2976811 RepID=UPI00227C8F85|nr:G5 domain-containing protein [Aerococcus sp. Group 2]MCY3036324.1 G5 domain-containing protein [Aerococcus sp. Group 2]
MISEKSSHRSYRYAIKRLNIGVASVAVAVGLLFMGETSVAQAASNEGVTSANVAGLADGQEHPSGEADQGSRALSLDSSHSLTEKVGESVSQPVSSTENRAAYYSDLEASDEVLVGGDEQPTYVERNREADQTRTVEDRVIDHKEVADNRTVTETGLGRNHFDRIGPNVTKYDPTEYNPAKADRGPENVQAVQFGNSNALGSRMIHNVQSQRGALVKKEAVSFDKDFELNLEVRLDHHNNTTAADGFGFLFIEGANKGQAYLNQGGILKNRGVAKAFGYKIDIRYNPETSQMDKQGMSNRIAGNQHRGYTAFVRNDQAGNSRIVGSSHGFEYNNKRMQGRYERDADQFRPEEFEPLLLKYSARSGQFQAIYGDGAGRIVQSINAQALGIDRRKQYTFAITSEVAPYYRGGAGVAVRQDGTARITYSKQEKARVEETRLVRQERESGFDTVYKYNPNLDKGLRRTIQEGKKTIVESQIHIKTINKKEVSRRLVSERVLQQGQNRIIEIGTREVKKVPQVTVKEIPYQTITRENPNLPKGQRRVIQTGLTGRVEETTTTTYVNGRPQPNPEVTHRVLRDKRDEIVEVGTQEVRQESQVTIKEIPYQTITRENPNLPKGERRLIQSGLTGRVEETTTTTYVNGRPQPNPEVTSRVLRDKRDEIVEVGTQEVRQDSQVTVKEIPYQTITRENPNLPKGERRVIQTGITGRVEETTTTTYVNGQAQPNPEVTRRVLCDKRDEIVEVGTQVVEVRKVVRIQIISNDLVEIDDRKLAPKEIVVVQEGQPGKVQTVTETTYINGVPQPNPKVTRTVLAKPINRIIRRGYMADGYRSANVGSARALTYSSPRAYRSATYRPTRVRRSTRTHYNRPSYSRFFRR